MKTVSPKKKSLPLDTVLANVEAEMVQIVAGIVAERCANQPPPRRRNRAHHPKGHAHAA